MKLTSLSLTQSTHSWLSTFSRRYCDCLYLILLGDIQFPNMDGLKNIILLQFHPGSQPPPPPTHLVFVTADRKRCIFFSLSDSLQPASHSRLPRNPPKLLPGESRFFHFSHLPLSICNIGWKDIWESTFVKAALHNHVRSTVRLWVERKSMHLADNFLRQLFSSATICQH